MVIIMIKIILGLIKHEVELMKGMTRAEKTICAFFYLIAVVILGGMALFLLFVLNSPVLNANEYTGHAILTDKGDQMMLPPTDKVVSTVSTNMCWVEKGTDDMLCTIRIKGGNLRVTDINRKVEEVNTKTSKLSQSM